MQEDRADSAGGPLGCVNTACIARIWNYICCPFCDSAFTFSRDAQSAPPPRTSSDPATAPASSPAPLNLDAVFAELDRFLAHIVAIPAVAGHPEVKKALDFLSASKEQLSLSLAEVNATQKMHQEKMAGWQTAVQQRKENQEKQRETRNTPSPPLDAKALGRALLKNLGFT